MNGRSSTSVRILVPATATLWMVLAGCAIAGENAYRALPELTLNHYAAPAPIKFTGKTEAEHEAAIRAHLAGKFPDLDMNAPAVRRLVKGWVSMVKGPTGPSPVLVGKYYNQVIRAYNAFPPIANAIAESGVPPEFKAVLADHYASLLIQRGLGCDHDKIVELLRGDTGVVRAGEGQGRRDTDRADRTDVPGFQERLSSVAQATGFNTSWRWSEFLACRERRQTVPGERSQEYGRGTDGERRSGSLRADGACVGDFVRQFGYAFHRRWPYVCARIGRDVLL